MKALITLSDVECAVRLNASLEQSGIETVMVLSARRHPS